MTLPVVTAAALPRPPAQPTPGMSARRRVFGKRMQFYAPGLKRWQTSEWRPERPRRFLPVSVTGTACALQCDHCESKVLHGMATIEKGTSLFDKARALRADGTDGLLVSGGSLPTGEVPLMPHLDDMRRIREELGMRVIVHSGVVHRELADGLSRAGVDGVMIDVIGAEETIREVYHLPLGVQHMEGTLSLLSERGLRVIPHMVLGLHYGRFLGEWNALEMIGRYPVSTLVLVVLTPLTGTPMGALPPPPVEDVTDFFAVARAAMPNTTVNLGCGRPMGEMKRALDQAAVDQGLNGIAYPADGIIDYAVSSGLEPELHESCCSLPWVT